MADMRQLQEERDQALETARELKAELDTLRSERDSVGKALIAAQSVADQTKADAERNASEEIAAAKVEASRITQNAEVQARTLMEQAEEQARATEARTQEVVRDTVEQARELRSRLARQLTALDALLSAYGEPGDHAIKSSVLELEAPPAEELVLR